MSTFDTHLYLCVDRTMAKLNQPLRLQPEDVWSVNPNKAAIKATGKTIRYRHREAERFHRGCLSAKTKKKTRRAVKHGWTKGLAQV